MQMGSLSLCTRARGRRTDKATADEQRRTSLAAIFRVRNRTTGTVGSITALRNINQALTHSAPSVRPRSLIIAAARGSHRCDEDEFDLRDHRFASRRSLRFALFLRCEVGDKFITHGI